MKVFITTIISIIGLLVMQVQFENVALSLFAPLLGFIFCSDELGCELTFNTPKGIAIIWAVCVALFVLVIFSFGIYWKVI